jgi:hypothetical protein
MWKKMGVKEFPRGNNLWGHPLIQSSLTNSSPLSLSLVPSLLPRQGSVSITKTHEDREKLKDSRGSLFLFCFFPSSLF